jgi:hypothetical protein
MAAAREADEARIADPDYLRMFGLKSRSMTAGQVWRALCESSADHIDRMLRGYLRCILEDGPLARRLIRSTGTAPDRARLSRSWRELAACLADDRQF